MAGRKTKSDAPLMPSVPAAAVLSFLKDTRGLDSWTIQDLSKTLGISTAEAAKAITFLELQGYVKAGHKPREFFIQARDRRFRDPSFHIFPANAWRRLWTN